MPTYSYQCLACDGEIAVTHHMGGPAPQACECGGPLRRVYDAPTIALRGLDFARNSHQDLLANAREHPGLLAASGSGACHQHHGPGGHHGITPAVVKRMRGGGDAKR